MIDNINYRESCIKERDFWCTNMFWWVQYKRDFGFYSCCIIFTILRTLTKNKAFTIVSLASMTQSLLIGNSGDQKAGEGTRKRLKISILHFDNPALIKRYAKTLIGRCMNPEEQNMKALLVNLPKIWSLEDGAVGHRFGVWEILVRF